MPTELTRYSEKMFKARISRWGLRTRYFRNDWKALGALYLRSKRSGQPYASFKVRGRPRSITDLQKYTLTLGMTVDEFSAEAEGHRVPEYIQLATPEVNVKADGNSSKAGEYASETLFQAQQYPTEIIPQEQEYLANEPLNCWSQSPQLRQPGPIWPLDSAEADQLRQSTTPMESGTIWHQSLEPGEPQSIWPLDSAEADRLRQPTTQMESGAIWHPSPQPRQPQYVWPLDSAEADQFRQSTTQIVSGTIWHQSPQLGQPQSLWPSDSADTNQLSQFTTQMESGTSWPGWPIWRTPRPNVM
jgi:hypothetical protein